jgi:glutamate 5-kinase
MLDLVQQIADLHNGGHEVVVVSSGAVAAGRTLLGYWEGDISVSMRRTLSAVGQFQLMRAYERLFDIFNIKIGQFLLTRDDLDDREGYINAQDTLLTLLKHHVIPIINENDAVTTLRSRVGDNDTLSALVANLLEVGLLIILTDQAGVYTSDPRANADAQLIPRIESVENEVWNAAGGSGTNLGTGGMITKLQAARLASRGGVPTIIAAGKEPNVLKRIVAGELIGTRIEATGTYQEVRKPWLLASVCGTIVVDDGAARALIDTTANLLPVGIKKIDGVFKRGEIIAIVQQNGMKIAHGMTNYSSDDLRRISGRASSEIAKRLEAGHYHGNVAVHRNYMVFI